MVARSAVAVCWHDNRQRMHCRSHEPAITKEESGTRVLSATAGASLEKHQQTAGPTHPRTRPRKPREARRSQSSEAMKNDDNLFLPSLPRAKPHAIERRRRPGFGFESIGFRFLFFGVQVLEVCSFCFVAFNFREVQLVRIESGRSH